MTRTFLATVSVLALAFAHCAQADVVTEWNEIMQATTAVTPTAPDPAARGRSSTITQVAVFEAANSIAREFEPYARLIDAPPGASVEAAVIAAAHRALVVLYPDRAAHLDRKRAASLAALPAGRARDDGIAVGIAAADAILTLRRDDGFDRPAPYTPGTKPGDWRPAPPDNFVFGAGLGYVKPFSIPSGRRFRAPPPPPRRSRAYAVAYREVKEGGGVDSKSRTQHQADIAHFYADTDEDGIYYPAARQLVAVRLRSVVENARIFALIGIAVWDGVVACFETKYHFNLWRPSAAIQAGADDGNPKTEGAPEWRPLVEEPPFPSYTSGHGAMAGAARVILEDAFGADGHSITLKNTKRPEIVRRYSSFEQIANDIADSRVYGGVHFRFDQTAADRQGRDVGQYVLQHALRPKASSGGYTP